MTASCAVLAYARMGRLSDLPQETIDVVAEHLLYTNVIRIDSPWNWRGATIWNKRLIEERCNTALQTLLFQRTDCMIVRRCRELRTREQDEHLQLIKIRTYCDALSRVFTSGKSGRGTVLGP